MSALKRGESGGWYLVGGGDSSGDDVSDGGDDVSGGGESVVLITEMSVMMVAVLCRNGDSGNIVR